MAEQNRPFHLGGGGNAAGHHSAADTTFTKIFVGGLAWETQRETMRRYFEQFGEILEAVVITDKHTGRSKGYGFVQSATQDVIWPLTHYAVSSLIGSFFFQVTFKDPDAAMRACQDPSPVIDGRRANCNLASLGAAHRSRPPTPLLGAGRIWPPVAPAIASSSHHGSSVSPLSAAFFHQPAHYALPYSLYGYAGGISQDTMFPMSYYGLAGGQQHHLSTYYPTTSPGLFPNFFPYYSPYSQPSQAQGGFGLPYHQMLPYPYVPPQYGSASALLSLPTTVAPTATV